MATATETAKPKPVVTRTVKFLEGFRGTNAATVRITQRKGRGKEEVTDYVVTFVPADPKVGAAGATFKKVFEDTRAGLVDQEYSVLIDGSGAGITCTCAGSLHHGHCRHRDLIPVLLKARASN